MSGEILIPLAQWAGQTVAAAAVTDLWETARQKFARLIGRGDSKKTEAAERWLTHTREQLIAVEGASLESAQAAQAQRWEGRFADLLDEDPDAEADLRALIEEVQKALPAAAVAASDHSVAAGQDMNVGGGVNIADRGGVVARDVQGGISTGNPPIPGSAKG
jgi:hypothetical protein